MADSTRQNPILISGAGICSLLLAQVLLRASIPFLIFERDKSISFRAQGYRLRLSTEGLEAIEKSLGPEKFLKFWDKCGKTGGGGLQTLDAITGENIVQSEAQQKEQPVDEAAEQKKKEESEKHAANRPRVIAEALGSREGKIVGIARGDMRKLFLEGCEDYVNWGRNVIGYELTSDGVHAVFSDGTKSVKGEMLIGGEGVYSRIAKQVSDGKLKVFDTGARGIHGQAPTSAYKGLGEGVWRAVDDENPKGRVSIITNVRPEDMNDPDTVFGWTMLAVPGVIDAPGGNYSAVGKPAADIAKELMAKWTPKLKALADEMIVEDAAFWKITCSSPSGVPQWKNEPRVTVIGDAVHSMTPAGGIGANTAVRDSELLGRLLVEAGGYADGVTARYEKEMRVYGSQAVAQSYGAAKVQFCVSIDEETSATV